MWQMNLKEACLSWINKEVICGVIGCCYLWGLSVQDLRERMVSGRWLAVGALAAVVSQIMWNTRSIGEWIGGVLMGVFFIGVSRLTREGFGYGDSILITILGIYIGIWDLMYVLVLAFSLTVMISMIALIKFHFHRKKVLPFVPFLATGYTIFLLLEVL